MNYSSDIDVTKYYFNQHQHTEHQQLHYTIKLLTYAQTKASDDIKAWAHIRETS